MNNELRLKIHQDIFQKLYVSRIAYSRDRVGEILHLIDAWCYAYNGNNGEMSEEEIQERQDEILLKLGVL